MTKVEELRKVILHDWWYESKAIDEVDSLIAAAREEGAAEEREGVRIGSDFLQKGAEATLSNFLDDEFDRSSGRFVVITLEDCYIVPASLLAPDKENEK